MEQSVTSKLVIKILFKVFENKCAKLISMRMFFKGSVPSLISGLAFGLILTVGAFCNSKSPPKPLLQLGKQIYSEFRVPE